ncbi:MAG: Asp-tRNA(Asn)/Glu-tRNA(Gln) amidotransferase subunit GatA [bacterium]|nr:Asp-tRNA(Asn)/Glu-tRNA(Gln) amidotransferase subunit GatA [bacterium]
MEIRALTAIQLGEKIKQHELTAVDAVRYYLDRIAALEPVYHALITVEPEMALQHAAKVQQRIDAGVLTGPLAGIPLVLKDNLCVDGMRTTCGSKMLEHFTTAYTAGAVQNLEKAGAVILGKANMDEFAMGSTTETSYYGATKNPYDQERVAGGSSGGSCAAVALGECAFALGSDTGGSIRQPASHCGVVGMKPTYGTVSRYGLVAYASSLDQIGPVTDNVADCAVVLEAITSYDPKDSTSIKRDDTDFASALINDVRGMRIGIPRDYLADGIDNEIKEAILAAAELYRSLGACIEEFDLGLAEYAIPAYYVIASAEASSNLARFDGVKYGYRTGDYGGLHPMYKKTRSEGFGEEVKRRIMLGSFALSSGYYDAYYLKALQTRTMIKKAFDQAFEKYDLILGPTAPTTAPRLGESLMDPIKMYLRDIYTISANLAGLPAMSIPCGMSGDGLPIGLQLIGNCFEEKKMIRAAYTFEQTFGAAKPAPAMTETTMKEVNPA